MTASRYSFYSAIDGHRKGVRRTGVRLGNWLTVNKVNDFWRVLLESLRGERNYAILVVLLGCGLRRGALLA